MKRKWNVWMLLFVLLFACTGEAAFAKEKEMPQLAENAASAILIERDTGEVLFEKDSDNMLPPASMTKIMTMLLIMEAIEEGTIKYEDMVTVSENAASMGGSQVFLEPGEEMSVDDLLKAIAIASGNDAAVAMAEHIGGTEQEFVKMMNAKAAELGLENTQFQNPNGLPEADHYSSAHDLAVMAKELLKYENITSYTGIYEDYLRKGTDKEFWLVNTNKLVKFYPGVDGLKTGFTQEAKYGLTATAEKNGMRVIAVVMGAETPKERNASITNMLDYSYSQYSTKRLHERGDLIGEVPVIKGKDRHVQAITPEPVSLLLKKGTKLEEIETAIELFENVEAPVSKGDTVGQLIIVKDGETLSRTDLVAAEDVENASWWTLFKRMLSSFAGK
ncbi:D-alanyl-D-alanine carboxypeptidase [Shouchella clausii]|uniref:serine-type D-Ala-D-Ala carboxypeptidase n=1 Tax=Shouchella clausii TaxID=79880 RepID=A0A268S1R7_SHOCL|nr:D-alanyl-D-alanine carboxypeptidase family protein [Shouchella clausii]PAD40851.1 D-alanyl-D-alanine carboxypeptidase [Bacillus sp. 7520-S]MBU8597179.1 D-alanyl-D-alanine carboxypeptidase [Shouchella clausii]MCY1104372.1 D-alanyl-D-alanine carboxypeptidase [Shouchella clausii]PAD09602.1 D-alanyl-D-alanine carboxypeptidase [Shouchella clausii]PAE84270.1 D-alanyl-D-alanine carboxypeptidase [Shouchella clausii]